MSVNLETTRVGILLVHGIGEQRKFENLEGIVRNIAAYLQSDSNILKVRIIVNSSDSSAYYASQETWLADDDDEPVIIEVKNQQGEVTQLAFREVWWADLDETISLKTQLTFWGWSLSLWAKKQYAQVNYGTSSQMRSPSNVNTQSPQIQVIDRLRFFGVSLVVLLILPLLSFLSVILHKVLGFDLRPDILVQYLGDVKLYQQEKRQGKGPLVDLGQPPRVSIRRRMIRGLVNMSLSNYDRWYVLSHSLGTIVAFNGLMETDAALPNYLNQNLWEQWQKFSPKKAQTPLTQDQAHNMFPSRPAWLELDDIIDRSDLFKNLKGFMTYGSPLSKFAVVWPAIVPINQDNSVFSKDFEWINVYDPTDPVADQTKYFQFMTGDGKIQPQEIAYKGDSIHLVSHIKYFTYSPKRKYPLVKQVAEWLLSGYNFQPSPYKNRGWPNQNWLNFYNFIRISIWVLAGWLVAWILSLTINSFIPELIKDKIVQLINLDWSNPFAYILIAIIIVIISGIVARLLVWRKES